MRTNLHYVHVHNCNLNIFHNFWVLVNYKEVQLNRTVYIKSRY